MTEKENAVLIDIKSKCPLCEHEYLTRVRFTRRGLLQLLRVLRDGEVKRKAKQEEVKA